MARVCFSARMASIHLDMWAVMYRALHTYLFYDKHKDVE
jgi:hypothetical protein